MSFQGKLTFRPFEEDQQYRAGPSFREMLVHGTKHRRLGCVADLFLAPLDVPHIGFYAIDNPFANPGKRIVESNFASAHRFMVDRNGKGAEKEGYSDEDIWREMVAP